MSIATPLAAHDIRVTQGADLADVMRLAHTGRYPCLSVLIATRAGRRLTSADRSRLEHLLRDASRRLHEEGVPEAGRLISSLRRVAHRAAELPPTEGLALFTAADHREIVQLPLRVPDRVIIDPTFATRDLLRAAQQFPPYTVVTVSGRGARLFESTSGRLRETQDAGFPMSLPTRRRELSEQELLTAVDGRLRALTADRQRPLFVVGTSTRLAALQEMTKVERLIAVPAGLTAYTGPFMLQKLVAPVLDRHLQSMDDAALDALRGGPASRHLVSGLTACWHAAASEQPELLLVEEGLSPSARLSRDGAHLIPAADREHPDVIDDAVDELVEMVLAKGGEVRFLSGGRLREYDGVALRVHLRAA